MNQMNSYESFLKPRRVMLADMLGPLSAGLSPRVFLSTPDPTARTFDLITFTTPRYMMGGAYFWRRAGTRPHPTTGSPVPYFKPGVPLPIESFYPVHDHPELSAAFTTGFFGIYKREATEPPSFEFQEAESERFGIPLLEHGINAIPSSKIEIRDLDGDGLPDIIVGENNWAGIWRESGKNGKKGSKN